MSTDIPAVAAWRKPLFPSLLATLIAACGQPPPQQALPPAEVNALEVQPRDLTLDLDYAAQLRGIREVEVRARVSGILLERRYDEGEAVKAGDVLFRIDPAPFQAEADRAKAELGVQQANLQQARRERDRILPLYDQKLASLRDRDTAIAAFEGAEAAVAAAQAAAKTANLNLSYTDVRAPIAGLTSREVRSEGSLVTAGQDSSLLTYIVQNDRLYVDLALAEGDAERVRAAHDARPDDVVVQVVDARGMPQGPKARIEFIAPRVDDATGTVAVRAVLDNTRSSLLAGRVVRAHIEGVTIPQSLVIPKRAVLHGAQGSLVWVIGAGDKVMPRPVMLGTASGNDVIVTSGLAAGDRVVVDGILKVQPGGAVHATMLGADGAPPPVRAGATSSETGSEAPAPAAAGER